MWIFCGVLFAVMHDGGVQLGFIQPILLVAMMWIYCGVSLAVMHDGGVQLGFIQPILLVCNRLLLLVVDRGYEWVSTNDTFDPETADYDGMHSALMIRSFCLPCNSSCQLFTSCSTSCVLDLWYFCMVLSLCIAQIPRDKHAIDHGVCFAAMIYCKCARWMMHLASVLRGGALLLILNCAYFCNSYFNLLFTLPCSPFLQFDSSSDVRFVWSTVLCLGTLSVATHSHTLITWF